MRIVAGAHRGRPLVAPKGHSTRPTADKTRQALLNVLEHAAWSPGIADLRVIDLFAGSGALGLETLSRGAAFCLLVDSDPAALAAISHNVATLRLDDRCEVRRWDATRLAPSPGGREDGQEARAFDIAFLDPPYAKGLAELALESLTSGGWLAPGALIVVERGADEGGFSPAGYEVLDSRVWGAARVWFLRHAHAPGTPA
jgi:16S rRNA (guanine966-N2)-methyltransferase